jgi:1-aminocyclopropane-1-carboxylate deaminase
VIRLCKDNESLGGIVIIFRLEVVGHYLLTTFAMMIESWPFHSVLQRAKVESLFEDRGVAVAILREDELHVEYGGNKWRKLKYPLRRALENRCIGVRTAGGAFSNHLAATAAACTDLGLQMIAFVRGDENQSNNPTLNDLRSKGVDLKYIPREDYPEKKRELLLPSTDSRWMNIPEGGALESGIEGCREILGDHTSYFTHIVCPVGTGTTLAGLILSAESDQKILGMAMSKKCHEQQRQINNWVGECKPEWVLTSEFAFGGFGKLPIEVIEHIRHFWATYGIKLDPVYTGKMSLGVQKLLMREYFPTNSRVLMIHTGGLQGWGGFPSIL